MENAEQYHQCPNLLFNETRLVRLTEQNGMCMLPCRYMGVMAYLVIVSHN